MTDGTLATSALLLGGGVAGYAFGRWVLAPRIARAASAPPEPATAASAPARPSPNARPIVPSPDVTDGPVTSPAQIDPIAGSIEPPSDPRPSRRFDRIFDRHRGSIPIEYLRALAMRESDMNPEERSGPAWGLMQIVEAVRTHYNQARGTKHTREDLLDPEINVAIACWLLRLIIRSYAKHHPDVPHLRADWDNPRFAELVTFGWVAGYSARGGVIRVVSYLKERHDTDITIDRVHQHANAAGASRHLSNPRKVAWSKGVVRLYQRERAATRA